MWKVLIVFACSLLLIGCTDPVSPQGGQPTADAKKHFTIADLERLGCKVDANPRITSMDIPLIGRMDAYGVSNGPACASLLFSTLTQAREHDPGGWAGMRASASNFADEHGYELSSYSGEVGEYSEIEVFTRHGKELGFRYNVQANGYIHSVTLISDSIDPSGEFEDILREKM